MSYRPDNEPMGSCSTTQGVRPRRIVIRIRVSVPGNRSSFFFPIFFLKPIFSRIFHGNFNFNYPRNYSNPRIGEEGGRGGGGGLRRNSSALPVQWLAASRTIRADSGGIEADKKTRYDIVPRQRHNTLLARVHNARPPLRARSIKMCLRSAETFDPNNFDHRNRFRLRTAPAIKLLFEKRSRCFSFLFF